MQTARPVQVEVFKTNIDNVAAYTLLKNILMVLYPAAKINLDLDDCDRILRIEGRDISTEQVIKIVLALGHDCSLLV